MQKYFGDILKKLRIEKGLTQGELAKIFNTGSSSISHYESNRRLPNTDTIFQYADYFGVSVEYIMGKTDVCTPENKDIILDTENKKESMFFADRLRYLMIIEDITSDRAAKELQIDKSEFMNYAKGVYFPSLNMLRKIANVFNTSLDYLLGVVDSPEKSKAINKDEDVELILPDYVEVAKDAQNKKIPAKVLSDFIKLYLNRDK